MYSPLVAEIAKNASVLYGMRRQLEDVHTDPGDRYRMVDAVRDAAEIYKLTEQHVAAAHVLRLDPPTEGMAVLGHFAPEEEA